MNTNFRYKDTVFRMLFSDKVNLLSLYNAISPKRCDNIEELRVVTLANAIYMGVKNDIAFLIGDDIHLYEHQSTKNPNMPLRFLEYITAEYQRLSDKKSLYSSNLINLPAPNFVVMYNGTEDVADHETMKLSSAFMRSSEDMSSKTKSKLELEVDVYNINAGHNEGILNACDTLKGYAEFVRRTRENQKTMPFEQAVSKAVDECIKGGILEEFFRANRSEVIGMSIFEFDREEHEKIIRAEEYAEGEARGEARGRIKGRVEALYELVRKNILSLAIAAKEAGQSEDDFRAGMASYDAAASGAAL